MKKNAPQEQPRNGGPRIPRERYNRVDRRVTRLEQRLGIRELQSKSSKRDSDWMSEEELIDLERRVKRIQKKLELTDEDFVTL